MKTGNVLTGGGCLLLVGLLLWQLAGDAFKPGVLFAAPDLTDRTPVLDSFSEPAVGLAILKGEADQLMLAYTEKRAELIAAAPVTLTNRGATGGLAGPSSGGSSPEEFIRPAAREASALKRLAQLRAQIQDVEFDFDRNLMTAYCLNASGKEFLDGYLRLLLESPEYPWGPLWHPYALECARQCGRLDEVVDALHHVLRFHSVVPCAPEITALLEQCEAQNRTGLEVGKRWEEPFPCKDCAGCCWCWR